MRVLGNSASALELSGRRINVDGGRAIPLSAIASARDHFGERRSLGVSDGRQVVSFQIEKAKGYSDLEVHDAVKAALATLAGENGGVASKERQNSVTQTKENHNSRMLGLVEGAILAVIVAFVFLRDWRATPISAIAIPFLSSPHFAPWR